MSRVIDKVRLLLYKKWRLQGNCKQEALKKSGFATTTAEHRQNDLKLVKIGEEEIIRELKAKDITVDYLIKRTECLIEKAETKSDLTNAFRGLENQAKFVGIDKGNVQITNIWNNDSVPDDDEALTKLARRRKTKQ